MGRRRRMGRRKAGRAGATASAGAGSTAATVASVFGAEGVVPPTVAASAAAA